MTDEEILEIDFYDYMGSWAVFYTPEEKIKYYRKYILHEIKYMTNEEILDETMRCTINDEDDLDNPENFYFKYNDVRKAMDEARKDEREKMIAEGYKLPLSKKINGKIGGDF